MESVNVRPRRISPFCGRDCIIDQGEGSERWLLYFRCFCPLILPSSHPWTVAVRVCRYTELCSVGFVVAVADALRFTKHDEIWGCLRINVKMVRKWLMGYEEVQKGVADDFLRSVLQMTINFCCSYWWLENISLIFGKLMSISILTTYYGILLSEVQKWVITREGKIASEQSPKLVNALLNLVL